MVPSQVPEELRELLIALVDGRIGPDEADRLDDILRDHPDRQDFYGWFMALHGMLLWRYSPTLPDGDKTLTGEHTSSIPHVPVVRADSSPVAGFFPTVVHGPFGYLSAGWPVAYLIATVICGIGLLVGGLVRVSQPERIADLRSVQKSPLVEPQVAAVGRITGMANCRWENGVVPLSFSDVLSVGTQIRLESGLMEVSYDAGAKVILEGPAKYEVESTSGGYLSVGRLTAKVDKGLGMRDKSLDIPHPSSLIPHPLFVIHTPTAAVTDLGTEFGVEVAKSGETTSHVFRGSVRVQAIAADGQTRDDGRILRENESVRVEGGTERKIVVVRTLRPSHFVREIPKRTIKVFDLVDVVAGGDGFSGKRNAGIHPLTGEIVTVPRVEDGSFYGDGQYHRVPKRPFVDGIFVPDGRKGPVQVTSAGHRFDGFTNSHDTSGGYAWAGGVLPMLGAVRGMTAVPATLSGVDYSSAAHGLIYLHANKGITFDLEATRRANPEHRIGRFRAVAGYTGPEESLADLWVLVDGQAQFRRRQINSTLGAMPVELPIRPQDRFLTLVATDGGDGIGMDFAMFGDPCLELLPKEAGSPP
jgi:hypothetical protein